VGFPPLGGPIDYAYQAKEQTSFLAETSESTHVTHEALFYRTQLVLWPAQSIPEGPQAVFLEGGVPIDVFNDPNTLYEANGPLLPPLNGYPSGSGFACDLENLVPSVRYHRTAGIRSEHDTWTVLLGWRSWWAHE
jgi:hypothetical protein